MTRAQPQAPPEAGSIFQHGGHRPRKGGSRRKITQWLLLLCLSVLTPALMSAQQGNECKRIDDFPFRCIVGACQQTVRPNRGLNLTFHTNKCIGCWTTIPCCGLPVCSAAHSTFTCDGGDPLGLLLLLQQAKDWDAARLASVYVPTCAGGFVRLKYLVRMQATLQGTSSDASQEAPSETRHAPAS